MNDTKRQNETKRNVTEKNATKKKENTELDMTSPQSYFIIIIISSYYSLYFVFFEFEYREFVLL